MKKRWLCVYVWGGGRLLESFRFEDENENEYEYET